MTRTGNVWHARVDRGAPRRGARYGYRCKGEGGWETGARWYEDRVMMDPYAPLVEARRKVFGEGPKHATHGDVNDPDMLSGYDFESEPFDWEGVESPKIEEKDMIVYEMTVRAFTADASSGLDEKTRGSYAGVAARVDHLKVARRQRRRALAGVRIRRDGVSTHSKPARSHDKHVGLQYDEFLRTDVAVRHKGREPRRERLESSRRW